MLRGLTTATLFATDLDAARAWYADLLGVEPYYRHETPDGTTAYIEFRIGDYRHELGIIDARFAPHPGTQGVRGPVTYWHVDDVEAAYEHLLATGATPHHPPTVRGEGFVPASVVDPFGNVLGVMYNQHYLDVLAGRRTST